MTDTADSADQGRGARATDDAVPDARRCGTVALVGRPNVGKSTLSNALIGAKLSIISRKAQTTRHRIQGVLTRGADQFIFVDTPGFQTRHGGAMNRMMNRVVTDALAQADVVLHVVEAGKWSSADERILALLPASRPVILVANKLDALKDRDALFPYVSRLVGLYDYAAVVPVSALRAVQLDVLLDQVAQYLPLAEHLFEADELTDRSVRFLAAEIIREKVFRLVGDELPYGTTVAIEQWQEDDSGARISACIIVERASHRPILLGARGLHMKRIATEARQDMVGLLGKPVFLEIHVKVRKGWSSQPAMLRDLGYD